MYEFAATLRILVAVGGGLLIILAAGFGFKGLFRKSPNQIGDDQLTALDNRLAGFEARMGELEERLDFTERMLTDIRGQLQLPPKR